MFWRYAFDEAVASTTRMWWHPMSPPVMGVLLAVTAFVVALTRAGAFL